MVLAKNYAIYLVLFLASVCFPKLVLGQDKTEKKRSEDETAKAPQSSADDEGEGAEKGEDQAAEADEGESEGAGQEGEDQEGEDEGEEEPLKLPSSKSTDLDMSALGEMNPEKDLAEGGTLSEKEAQAQAVEDWTERELDILEIHGYFRLRPELYDNFNIRGDNAVYDRPMAWKINSDTDPEGYIGEDCRDEGDRKSCNNSTLAGANMRFRLEPTLNVSEEVSVKAQIDFLDNVMLGSTPRFWQNFGDDEGSLVETGRVNGWDMGPPDSSQMVVVRRAWGEVMTPFGQLRFGRMGDHWGTGMLHNSGGELDQDFGDSVDRLMFAAKINDWLIAPAFDFPNEGVSANDASGRPFDVSQLDDAYQLVGIVAYKHDREEQLSMLKRGDWLINTGIYFPYRWQVLSFEENTEETVAAGEEAEKHFFRRDMWSIMPDFWFQFLYDTFHMELEAALIYGELGNPDRNLANFDEAQALTLLQYGGVLQIDYGLLSDQLRLGLEFGFASGDEDVEGVRAPATFDQLNGVTDTVYQAFAFNPAYNTDLILYHHILGSVSQSYYFNVWLRYDFLKSALGRQMSIQFDGLFSRAVFAQSTINNDSANLGIELDFQAFYVSEDNFHAGIKYGVLFPLGAFKGIPLAIEQGIESGDIVLEDYPDLYRYYNDDDLSIPQTIQAILGITF
jgi:uncharacterized protein (TIGR04551 family)